MKSSSTKKLVLAAICTALGIVLPMLLHSIPQGGNIFLPMHLPVLLCGFLCGPWWGLACGIVCCTLSHLISGMPPAAIFPGMLCELAVYGLVSGFMFNAFKNKKKLWVTYLCLIVAMLSGRIVGGILNALIFRAGDYSMAVWLTGSFVTGLPGIAIQLVLIPLLVSRLHKAGFIRTEG